jgi:anti-anti-sigma regulatory factor
MDNFSCSQTTPADQPGTRVVTIKGSMTIQQGAEIQTALLEAMAAGDTILLDLNAVTEIDLIGLQFICSAHRTSLAEGKRFSVSKAGNRVIEAISQAAGVSRSAGCVKGSERTCAWVGGGV